MPDLSMERPGKVATPALAATEVVPESVPPPGLAAMAMLMVALELVAVFEKASCTVTWTDGAMATPATVFEGCTVTSSLAAAAGEMLKAVEVPPVRGADAAVRV